MWINNDLFLIKQSDIPKVPMELSLEARDWWKYQKKCCIEGVTYGGRYMPGTLYFYINFWNILLNKGKSKNKVIERPQLRDIEWEVHLAWMAARGVSGFDNVGHINDINENVLKYVKNSDIELGCPVYENNSKDLMLMTARETGKSYIASGLVGHEWIFNGVKRYGDQVGTVNIIVGAGASSYSTAMLKKVKLGIDVIATSGIKFGNKYYPHPFMQQYSGGFTKEIEAQYDKKTGGTWNKMGTHSITKNVSYGDNPYAGQGTRNSVMIKEEIGMFKGLIAAQEADIETMKNGSFKFGSCFYLGTGGDMGGGTLDAYKMYYSPETYDLLQFEDIWENKGSIAMFLPATMRPNEFKDKNGNTNTEQSLEYFTKERDRLKNSKNGVAALNAHIQYNPLVPSEIFLRSTGSLFPISELKDHLSMLETNKKYQDSEFVCDLIFNEDGIVEPRLNPNLKALRKFPLDQKDDTTGAITIFEHPKDDENGEIPWGRYIAGIDPYDQNQALNSSSIGSMLVMDRWTETIVCEYSGRPSIASQFYENCRKVAIYYNCAVLYENEKTNIFHYFETKNSIKYMMKQPDYIKEVIPNSSVQRGYGMHMVEALKSRGEELARDEMLKEYQEGKLNLRKYRSIPLLQEMIMYEREGNYDRVDAFVILMFAKQEFRKIKTEAFNSQNDKTYSFFDRKIFSRK